MIIALYLISLIALLRGYNLLIPYVAKQHKPALFALWVFAVFLLINQFIGEVYL